MHTHTVAVGHGFRSKCRTCITSTCSHCMSQYSLFLSAGWFIFVAGKVPVLCGMIKFRCSSCFYSKMSYQVYVLLINVDPRRWLWGIQLFRTVRSRRCRRTASFDISDCYFASQLHACHFPDALCASVVAVDSGLLSALLTRS